MTTESTTADVRYLRLSDDQIRQYREEGFLQIRGVLSPETAEALRAEVMDIMRAIGGFEANKLKQTTEYLETSLLDSFVNHPNARKLAEQLMGGPSTLYMPFTAVKGSGGGKFHFHQDNQYTRFDNGLGGINLWFALTEMSTANGCLMVVPKSHLNGTLEADRVDDGHRTVRYEPADFVPILMQPGDCVAFSRLTVHGSGPNTTPAPRVAYALQYHRNDVNALREDGQWQSLRDFPRWSTKPVKVLTIPKGKTDGH